MAGKSLGTLTIDLVAKVGGFVSGMDKAERASAKWSKQVQDDVAKSSAALAGIGAAAIAAGLAVGASGFQLLKSTSRQIAETDRWAKSLQLSTQELLAWQFAAEKAGVSGDQMADIFKDIGDKIGDAVLNKSGEAVDALNALGLSAEKLSKVSPDKQLLAIGESLGKISTNAEKTTILESLGNDLSKLLPLFDNNNQKLKQFIDLAKDYGVAPDPSSIDDLVKVNQLFEDMEAQVAGLKIEIAAGLAKVDLTPLQGSLDKLHDVLTDPLVLQGISDLVSEVAQLAGWLVKAAAGAGQLAASTGNRFAALSGKIDLTNIDQVNERIEYLQKILEGKKGFYSQSESMFGWITGVDDSAKALNDELQSLIETRDKFSKASKSVLPLQVATVGTDNPFSLPPGGTNGKPVKTPTSKTESAFNSRLLDLQKQAALIETTGKKTAEVTELEKINFDITSGNLKKLSEAQKEQLRTAAKVLDSKKEELRLNQENARVAEYVSGLEKQNKLVRQGFDNQIVGRYSGSRERSRMQDNNDIQQDFSSRQDDLLNQLQSGDIDQSLYDKKKEALQNSLDERLKIQEEYYKKQDELQNDDAAGFISGLATQIEASMDLYTNMQQVGAQAFSTLTDMIINWAETGKLNVKDFAATFLQSVGSTLLSYAAAQVAMAGLQAFTAMIGVPFVGPEIAGPAAIAATAAAGVLAIGVGTALQGQAHDGIDSVPETGTWLLQKGERVTTAKTSAKLDATLDRVANQSTGGGALYSPTINIPINGNPSDATLALVRKAADEGAERGYRKAVNSVASGQGDLHKALMGKTTSGRKIS
ncbi:MULTISPECIES: phage tail tape measure protein [Klebsiella pneumoniae complex]|uniref:phage tail tape measure protein n=1 Tax=Klebsiella pneumoniae complex TaxID=3390273 RepID=UPI000EF26AA4|nr:MULTISPECIES: phage tail tape measure protein [Klebsiella]RLL49520.1 phage tail tape measure protein [Klebsiella pneumoniae]TBO66286.1 phage tail tape measure protein [Klebsiella quasipneumoniae subsp. similipneumoniae]TBO80212.1 phage tail tape measure protein [Klebsiella quasipneumoniae subsp. similipneumoniae]TBO84947.1 phage tail tape measure protein [Klebsiella quasipneumoniae subsp. similipneumoniae]TBO91368.1 phage tail tape measure protein [Klebsiella quasipneumoniae subsp. similipn